MGVLESMRSSSDSTFMQVVMVAVVISFIAWYSAPQGENAAVIATVNGEMILGPEFRRLYSSAKAQRERKGEILSDKQEEQLREQVRQQLITEEVVRQEAVRHGLEVSKHEILSYISTLPGVKQEDGSLNRAAYEEFLEMRGLSEASYNEQIYDQLITQKMRELVMAGTTISDPVLRRTYALSNRKVDLEYARIRPSAFFSSIQPTEEELETWFAENEQMAKDTYDDKLATVYTHPDQLHVGMILLDGGNGGVADLLPMMNSIREELADGADFATLARKYSEHVTADQGGDLGMKPVIELEKSIVDGVEGLEVGAITDVLTSSQDLRIYKLLEKKKGYVETFEEVREKIALNLIREDQAPTLAAKFAEEELLPAWRDSGAAPTDLLKGKGLTASTTGLIPVTGGGAMTFGRPPADLMAAAADAAENTVLDEVFEVAGTYWVAQVKGREEADLAKFETDREKIAAQELARRRNEVLQNWEADAVSKASVK